MKEKITINIDEIEKLLPYMGRQIDSFSSRIKLPVISSKDKIEELKKINEFHISKDNNNLLPPDTQFLNAKIKIDDYNHKYIYIFRGIRINYNIIEKREIKSDKLFEPFKSILKENIIDFFGNVSNLSGNQTLRNFITNIGKSKEEIYNNLLSPSQPYYDSDCLSIANDIKVNFIKLNINNSSFNNLHDALCDVVKDDIEKELNDIQRYTYLKLSVLEKGLNTVIKNYSEVIYFRKPIEEDTKLFGSFEKILNSLTPSQKSNLFYNYILKIKNQDIKDFIIFHYFPKKALKNLFVK